MSFCSSAGLLVLKRSGRDSVSESDKFRSLERLISPFLSGGWSSSRSMSNWVVMSIRAWSNSSFLLDFDVVLFAEKGRG